MKKLTTHNQKNFLSSTVFKAILFFSFTFMFALNVQANCDNQGGDKDQDGICDDFDNCYDTYNPVQADYDNDGIGDLCDYSHDCDNITSIRRAINLSTACSGSADRVLWVDGAYCREIGDLYFIEYKDGTARLEGRLQEFDGNNIAEVDVTFTGKTENGKPFLECADDSNSADWYYYSNFYGTIGGLEVIPNAEHNFQVGFGANVKNQKYGASGWLTLDGIPTDFNFDLGEPLSCEPTNPGNSCDDVLVYYDLDACLAYDDWGSFDEFTPSYPGAQSCSDISATNVYRMNASEYGHSCLPGASGNALCISGTYVDYLPEASVHRLKFSTTIEAGTEISGLSFYQKSEAYILNNGQDDPIANNYLKKYAVRVFIDGVIVYESANNSTSQSDWSLATFDLSEVSELDISGTTTVDFELVAYDPINNGASMRAWELDEIKILGCCAKQSIGDKVFIDDDANGIQNGDEAGVQDVTVNLISAGADNEFHTADDVIVDTKTTDENGEYLFNDVAAGTYCIEFVKSTLPAGFGFTKADRGGDEGLDSDADLDGKTGAFTVVEGQGENLDFDAGVFEQGSIGDRVWFDENTNGIQDDGEEGLQGVFIFLADEFGNELADVPFEYTDADGSYKFEGLPLGKYVVRFATPSGYILTGQAVIEDDAADSDANILDGKTDVIMLTSANRDVNTIDAGYFLPINLPVTLERFMVEKESCFSRLTWIASAEENFSHYEVQWSSSRQNFKTVGQVNTEGGRGTQYYYFTHRNTSVTNYYRLKMIDLDGTYEYSDIINIDHDCNEAFGMSVFPNPVKKWDAKVGVKFFTETADARIHIVDGMGKVVRQYAPALSAMDWNLVELEIEDLPSGVYYIMIDENRQAGKFILTE